MHRKLSAGLFKRLTAACASIIDMCAFHFGLNRPVFSCRTKSFSLTAEFEQNACAGLDKWRYRTFCDKEPNLKRSHLSFLTVGEGCQTDILDYIYRFWLGFIFWRFWWVEIVWPLLNIFCTVVCSLLTVTFSICCYRVACWHFR